MKRNYSLFRIALVLATGCAVFLPVNAPAPTVHITIPQFYLGFSQSIENPDAGGPAALNIPSQTPDGDFQGFITILGSTYTIRGKVDDDGNLEFNSGRAGPIKGKGKWQDLTRGAALLQGTYKLSSGDQGKVDLLRNFTQPSEPEMPPDIAGFWRGTLDSVLPSMTTTVEWMIQQDRTPTGAPGTGFMGQEMIGTMVNDFVGTIDGGSAGDPTWFYVDKVSSGSGPRRVIGGGKFESGELKATTVENSADSHGNEFVSELGSVSLSCD